LKGLFNDAASFLIVAVGMILSTLLKDEALGFLSRFARWLVERAVRRLPEEHRDAHRQEWLATLEYEGQDGKKLSELYAALHAWLGAGETARVLEPEPTLAEEHYAPVDATPPQLDLLTLLPSRVMFWERLESAVRRAKRDSRYKVALVCINVDNFKRVNDTFGHPRGDELLVAIARRLEALVGEGATVARYGGDEFMVLLEASTGFESTFRFAETLLKCLSSPFEFEGDAHTLSASVGIALLGGQQDAEQLLKCADSATYRAKMAGGASYCIFGQ